LPQSCMESASERKEVEGQEKKKKKKTTTKQVEQLEEHHAQAGVFLVGWSIGGAVRTQTVLGRPVYWRTRKKQK